MVRCAVWGAVLCGGLCGVVGMCCVGAVLWRAVLCGGLHYVVGCVVCRDVLLWVVMCRTRAVCPVVRVVCSVGRSSSYVRGCVSCD